jgi:hypothetical protein
MKNLFSTLFFCLILSQLMAQRGAEINPGGPGNNLYYSDTTSFQGEVEIKLDGETKYTDYKIISIENDTTIVDTTLTLRKDFKMNYLRRDNFELMPFHNMGQTFNKLGYSFENNSMIPSIGATAKQYNHYRKEDVYYYEVPTPTTEVMYRSGLEQGQMLDALFTSNTSPNFNFSFAYKGLRSLGKYRHSLASHGNFRTSFLYHSKNKKYSVKGHYATFDLLNQENGGLPKQSIEYFENDSPDYIDRARLDVRFTNAESMFEGKRSYLDQSIQLFSKRNQIERRENALKARQIEMDSLAKLLLNPLDSLGVPIDSISINDSTVVSMPIDSLRIIKDSSIVKDSINIKSKTEVIKDSLSVPKPNTNIEQSAANNKVEAIKPGIPKISEDGMIRNDSLPVSGVEVMQDSTVLEEVDTRILFNMKLGHAINSETQHYRFNQSGSDEYFGAAYRDVISDHTSYQKINNEVYLEFNSYLFGRLRAKANHLNYNYHYNSILYLNETTIPDRLKGKTLAVGADWKTNYKNFNIYADVNSIISGDLSGNHIKASAVYKKDSVFSVKAVAEITSKTPNFNKLLYQSDYVYFNWKNDFDNEEIKRLSLVFNSEKWGNIKASYNLIDNYTYFDTISLPKQATESLNYIRVKINKDISWRNFTLDNTVLYQKVSKGEDFFRVPELLARSTLYYANHLFKKKPLYLQTGITAKYFTSFKIGAFNPLLNEFYLQEDHEIGNFPMVDFFFNAQIRRTRLYLKIENITSKYTGRTYYAAPDYPYRDFTVRFGIVWNWFI